MTDTPRPLMDFWRANQPSDQMTYKDASWKQRDYLEKVGHIAERMSDQAVRVSVVGEHRSKSIILPVVQYDFANGASLVVRDNFYNYAVSVKSPVAIPADVIKNVGETGEGYAHACYCEGFPEDKVYKEFNKSATQFTTHVWDRDLFSYFVTSFAKLQKTVPAAPGAKL